MSSHEKIKAIVFGAIDEFNMSQEVDAQLKKSENVQKESKDESRCLYG